MSVQSRGNAGPQIGFLRPAHIERAFVILVYGAVLALIVLSFIGTCYARLARDAPLLEPWRVAEDVSAAPGPFAIGFAVQLALMLTQYGARQFAHRDRRWWLLYLVALGISVYYNVEAYWSPLAALGLAWYVSGAIILAGDIVPEIAAVRRT